jgi:hypothetical protein
MTRLRPEHSRLRAMKSVWPSEERHAFRVLCLQPFRGLLLRMAVIPDLWER